MARILTLFERSTPLAIDARKIAENHLCAEVAGKNTLSNTTAFRYISKDGHFFSSAVYAIHQTNPIHVCSKTGCVIIIDGKPQLDARILLPEDILVAFLNGSLGPFLERVDGSWVIYIYDPRNKQFQLIRDSVGLKPAYFVNFQKTVVAGSSPRSVISSNQFSAEPNYINIGRFCATSHRSVFGRGLSFFDGVELVKPASINKFEQETGSIETHFYWEMRPFEKFNSTSKSVQSDELLDTLSTTLKAIINSRDQNPILTISGGIDSGAIAAVINKILNIKIEGATVLYNEHTSYDERDLTSISAKNLSNWHTFIMDCNHFEDGLINLYDKFDQPLPTVSAFAYDFLYENMPSQNFYLSGAAGDIFLSGNFPCFFYRFAGLVASAQHSTLEEELDFWIKFHSTEQFPKTRKSALDFIEKKLNVRKGSSHWSTFSDLLYPNLLSKQMQERCGDLSKEIVPNQGEFLRSYALQEYRFENVPVLVECEDQMDWLYHNEVLSPYLFKDMMELGWRTPPELKIKKGVSKALTRDAYAELIPDEILYQRSKKGFNAPIDIWFRGEMKNFLIDLISSQSFKDREIYNLKTVEKVVGDHISRKKNNMMILWPMINVELWFQNWID